VTKMWRATKALYRNSRCWYAKGGDWMKLSRVHLLCPEIHLDLDLNFEDEAANPRSVTLVYGGPGIGKTLLLNAIAHTRPGYTVAFSQHPGEPKVTTRCFWQPGIDEPDRKGVLELATPGPQDDFRSANADKRREAAFFDRLARDGGFVFLAFSALRWFSHAPLLLNAPDRTLVRHDARAYEPLGDATRHDLTRATLAALVYAEVSAAMPNKRMCDEDHELLAAAMRRGLSAALSPFDVRYLGLNPRSLEPMFATHQQEVPFHQLSTQAKNTVALVASVVRVLWAGYPGLSPLMAQGVIAIDQVELHHDPLQANALLSALSDTFPHVQWIATTRSSELLALRDPSDVLVLRRTVETGAVQVFSGEGARIH
jgi:predicted ATPase